MNQLACRQWSFSRCCGLESKSINASAPGLILIERAWGCRQPEMNMTNDFAIIFSCRNREDIRRLSERLEMATMMSATEGSD